MTETLTQIKAYTEKPDDYQLRDNIISRLGGSDGVAFSRGTFLRYKNGIWSDVDDLEVRQEISRELESARGFVNPTLNREMSVLGTMKSQVYAPSDAWDADPTIIVCKNKTIQVPGLRVKEHSPKDMATSALPYDYDSKATAPTWNYVIQDLLSKEEARFFQEFAGYCLTHSVKYQMGLWLFGPRGGGRSTLTDGLEAMLGSMSGVLGLRDLSGSGGRFALGSIGGKTLLTCTENPKDHIKQADILNALITGDSIRIERKHRDAYEHQNTAKLLWSLNALPGLHDMHNGLYRRIYLLELGAIPDAKKDPEIKECVKLEGAGILNWALDGLARLEERGKFQYPKSVLEATERWRSSNDLPLQFILDRCEREPSEPIGEGNEYTMYAQALTRAFSEWAKDNGHQPLSTKALAPEWIRLGLTKGNRKPGGIPYFGVKLKK